MSVNLIRKNSDTPNIRNYDDARLFRYIIQDRSGIIKDYGDELAMSKSGNNILHIASGEIVHQGWQVEISSGGFDITLDNRDSVEYYSVYLEINLSIASQQKAEIKFLKGNADYPIVNPGDDLTTTPTGTSRLLIAWVYLVPSSSTFTITRKIDVITYYPSYALNASEASHASEADYASSDHSKGTIEQRLTDLGFKQGSLSITGSGYSSLSISANSLTKQGQMVNTYVGATITGSTSTYNLTISVPNDFRPIYGQTILIRIRCSMRLYIEATSPEATITEYVTYDNVEVCLFKTLSSSGQITISNTDVDDKLSLFTKYYGGVTTRFQYSYIGGIMLLTGWKLN